MLSNIVVLATFQSVAAGTETMPAPEGEQPTYRPVLTMTFDANQYLKGTGPNQFTVEMRSEGYETYRVNGKLYNGYLTQADALAEANRLITARNTKYDSRPGILFLTGPITPVPPPSTGGSEGSSTSSSSTYGFVLHHRKGSFDYSVDTTSRTWLPAKQAPAGGTAVSSTTPSAEYITDGAKTPPPVIALSALQAKIADIAAQLSQGADVEGWEQCIYSKLTRSHVLSHIWPNWDPPSYQKTINSGIAEAAVLGPILIGGRGYNIYWTKGPDGSFFKGLTTDDDTDPVNGYHKSYVTARPLPAGSYTVHTLTQHHSGVPCNFKPDDRHSIHNVTVTAPAGTLHEAFFDPTAAGTGDVSPASFTVNGTATKITGLTWSDGKVGLSLNPYVSLAGYTLDFIELDGTGSLNLRGLDSFDDGASISSPSDAGTLLWNVSNQPWENGDKLMLRIREDSAAAPPVPASPASPPS